MNTFERTRSSICTYFSLLFFLWVGPSSSLEHTQTISYSHLILEEHNSAHILEVDPKQMTIIAAKAKGPILETVPTIAKRYHAVAAVNGGFFQQHGDFADLPMGILKIDNAWCATPHKPRGAIGWSKDGNPLFDQVLTSVMGNAEGTFFPINGINRIRKENQIILYNSFFHKRTSTNMSGVEYLIKNRTVEAVSEGNSKIPEQGWILSVATMKKPSITLKRGEEVAFNVNVIPQSKPAYTTSEMWNYASYIVGGCPILIRDSNIITDFSLEKTNDNFLYKPHARTAVGLLSNGHWIFVTIDGSDSLILKNKGMTIPELANFMKSLGCVEALNLDGGGSTTLFYRGSVVNHPCGEENDGTRKVSDAILLIPK